MYDKKLSKESNIKDIKDNIKDIKKFADWGEAEVMLSVQKNEKIRRAVQILK